MSTGAPDDAYTRASDPNDLVRAELAQMKGLGRLANVAFQKGGARLESWGLVEPMSDNERRVRALSAGDMIDTLTDLPAGGAGSRIEIHRDRRPLKNRSGGFDDSARARRTQPHAGHHAGYRGVEIVDGAGSPIGEFDRIAGGVIFEDKSAAGLSIIAPGKTTPNQTPAQWAERQIFQKTKVRVQGQASAAGTRPTAGGTPNVPSLAEVRSLRTLEFSIDADTPALRSAVDVQLRRLHEEFPTWTFRARFGGR
jgi:hypothetical protein